MSSVVKVPEFLNLCCKDARGHLVPQDGKYRRGGILAEEWEKRELLEKEKEEQLRCLEDERQRREHLEQVRRQKDRELNCIAQKLSSLKSEKVVLSSQLQHTQKKLSEAEFASKTLERRMKTKKREPSLKRAVSADLTNLVATFNNDA
ncbi:hypothetical protein HPB47_002476 [Ixodes persulcatus]|uniref:Uncharacterized protein n=1 Tax=Ixodes persulcatus TaxID=34615 RepID=A0AC60PLI3_IXOPE|nr:hypothetical protein HPB47_002476 [Ixodes persulcatus]